jgi:uncharacterized membrane protein
MPTLVVIAYRDETSAAVAGEEAQRLVRHLGIEPDAIAVVRRDADGRFHLTTNHHPVAGDATWGMVWMLVFTLLVAPPSPRPRHDAGVDALLEMIAGSGVDERFRAEVRDRLEPGTSALFLALGTGRTDRVVEVLGHYGGQVLKTTITAAQQAALQEMLHGGRAAGSGPEAASALSAGRGRALGTG